jgi:uncharacterized protein (DUF2252 family)
VQLSVQERHEVGRACRSMMPRLSLAQLRTPTDRPDPVESLEEQNSSRVTDLVPIRYQRMLTSPLAFFRGAATIMATDLAAGQDTALHAQLCGDAHLSNFGLFGSPERNLVFDINDFDETRRGPWEWDVKRLVASLAIAGRSNGFHRDEREQVLRACAKAYRERMRTLAEMGELDVWYAHTTIDDALRSAVDHRYAHAIRDTAAKARSRTSLQALSKLTCVVDGKRRLVSDPPVLIGIDELVGEADARRYEQRMSDLMAAYRESLDSSRRSLAARYRYAGMARKVVGVGSVGLQAWVVMLLGRDDGDPLLMQVKEARPSVLEEHLGPSGYANAAERVVEGQRLTQASSDIMLGWLRCVGPDGREADYYVRQLHDWKGSADVDSATPQLLADYGRSCGEVLAGAHARTGDRIAIASYLGSGDTADLAFTEFAEAYADQNERDYAALRAAAAAKRLPQLPAGGSTT